MAGLGGPKERSRWEDRVLGSGASRLLKGVFGVIDGGGRPGEGLVAGSRGSQPYLGPRIRGVPVT